MASASTFKGEIVTHHSDSALVGVVSLFSGLGAFMETAGSLAMKMVTGAALAFASGFGLWVWSKFKAWFERRKSTVPPPPPGLP